MRPWPTKGRFISAGVGCSRLLGVSSACALSRVVSLISPSSVNCPHVGVFLFRQVLAAFAYSRNFEGIWFLNPQKWVTQHLFKAASIWDIPLVKPRFSCSLDPSLNLEELDLKYELSEQLGRLVGGATCESGYLNVDRRTLH